LVGEGAPEPSFVVGDGGNAEPAGGPVGGLRYIGSRDGSIGVGRPSVGVGLVGNRESKPGFGPVGGLVFIGSRAGSN
jgi:hypothetical protein